jgi:hypothetical protein
MNTITAKAYVNPSLAFYNIFQLHPHFGHIRTLGSFAGNLYGTGRGTQDIDLVISASANQIQVLLSLLPPGPVLLRFG